MMTFIDRVMRYTYILSEEPPGLQVVPQSPRGAPMDVLSLLHADHEALFRLFLAYDRAGRDVRARGDACRALRARLRAHSHLEEEVLYPAVLRVRAREASAIVREALSEHQALDGLLAELDQLEPEAPEYEAKVQAL